MNKLTFALALGAGLVLSLAGPSVHATPIVQQLATPSMTAAEFNSLFQPVAAPILSPYQFMNTPTTGMVDSQVFQGTGTAAGLYAYAYQIAVNNVTTRTVSRPRSTAPRWPSTAHRRRPVSPPAVPRHRSTSSATARSAASTFPRQRLAA